MKAIPIRMRPACRAPRRSERRNSPPPSASSTGTSQPSGNDRIWISSAEPRLPPRISDSPAGKLSAPVPAKLAASRATAEELCRTMAKTSPIPAAPRRLLRWVITRLNEGPNARSIPVRTMRTA